MAVPKSERDKAWETTMMDYWDQAWWEFPAEDMSQDDARIRRYREFEEAFLSGEDLPPVTRPYTGWRPWHKNPKNNDSGGLSQRSPGNLRI